MSLEHSAGLPTANAGNLKKKGNILGFTKQTPSGWFPVDLSLDARNKTG